MQLFIFTIFNDLLKAYMMKKIYQDSTFYLIIFILSYFIYIYPFEILSELLFNEKANRKTSLYYSLLISVIVIFYFRSKNTFYPIKLFVYEGIGIGFISFWIMNIILIIDYFFTVDSYKLGIISIILILLITTYGLFFGRLIFLKEIKLSSNKITSNYNFLFISDLHLGTNSRKHLQRILKKIKNIEFDFILIGGDLIDSSSFDINQLSSFNTISKPIYFVTGNHEYYISEYKNKLKKLNEFGIKILNNEILNFKEINLIGIDDKQTSDKQSEKTIKLINKKYFNLLLIHKPSIWIAVKDSVDLMLSGHCHRGQIWPFNFLVRIQFKYNYGLYKGINSNLYVSSGAGCWGPRIRLGSRNEIINIQLKSKSKF